MVQKYTFTYYRVCGIDIELDIYLPDPQSVSTVEIAITERPRVPTVIASVVFFHGGGLTVGNREMLPEQLKDAVLGSSIALISADYRLLFPFSARHICEDVLALFSYLSTSVNQDLIAQRPTMPPAYLISERLFAVAGASAGAYLAMLAALYATPRPRALFSLYGNGGDLLSPFYVHQAPLSGWESNLGDTKMFLAPTAQDKLSLLPGLSNCPINLPSNIIIPGYEARVNSLYRKLLENGTFLDHLMAFPGLGELLLQAGRKDNTSDPTSPSTVNCSSASMGSSGTSPSSSDTQRLKKQKMEAAIPESIRYLFPQLHITSKFPPTYLVHGTNDKLVDCRESKEMAKRLYEVGVKCDLVLAGGLGHAFDMAQVSGAMGRVLWDRFLGEVVPFLLKHLKE
ncbi:Alpha/Beta hydrolase protein [Tirmania nivea]|nr:Alpha/Beta hydrolase protein [Tirmania nivea]